MLNQKSIIDWGTDYLLSNGCSLIEAPFIMVKTPWSIVVRFSTSNGNFYLKHTPADLFIEPDIIQVIQTNMLHSQTPMIIAKNTTLNCFLMESCGDYSLRTLFKGVIDADKHIKGIQAYINVLRTFEHNFEPLISIGVPDWRINRIPQLYVELLENKELLLEEGMTLEEIDKLMKLVISIQSICDSLKDQKVEETLVNGDFNENNLIWDEKTRHISIIDWGESIISHPFFSIASHLQSCARRYKLDLNSGVLKTIKDQCLASWLDVASLNELDAIYQTMLKLHPIFCALAIYRLQAATQNRSKEMQNWFIAGFLKKLI